MKKKILLSLLLLSCWSASVPAQNSSEFDIKTLARDMEKRFEACPRREVVIQSDRKHHTQVWEKHAWGPPADVFADVRPNDSLLYPYALTIEFSLSITFGPERQSKADAEKDTDLAQLPLPPLVARRGKYRNVYLAGQDGIRLKARELLDEKLDGTPVSWKERPSWPDACWDQIGAK